MPSDDEVVGLTGRLLLGTRGADGLGEVQVRVRGGTEVYLARSQRALAAGQVVLVVSALGSRIVLVEPWSDPGADVPAV